MDIKEPWNAAPGGGAAAWEKGGGRPDEKRGLKTKSKAVAGVLAILLPGTGAHKLYLGHPKEGAIMLAAAVLGEVLTGGVASRVVRAFSLAEGVIYLLTSDAEFQRIYVDGRRAWL